LKLGIYGILRFSLPLFPVASFFFTPLVYTIAILGILYASLTAIRQTDLKRIIAYTSVAHMNLVVMGLFSFNITGLEGSIIQSISHGFVSSALFLSIGVLYDRHHTRMIKYYSGLVHTMPLFVTILLLFTMSNIALPGTSSFIGEFLILAGVVKSNTAGAFIGAFGMVLAGAYSLYLFNRIAYGNIKLQYINYFSDINRREFFVLLPLVFGTLILGLYPEIFLASLHSSVVFLVEIINPPAGQVFNMCNVCKGTKLWFNLDYR
jgi:proton-translocating NADH-quinone oxidoreductase chain M